MEDQFVPYELALKLKELGFKEDCLAWYVSKNYGLEIGLPKYDDLIKDACLAPLWEQVFEWFRNNHKLRIYVDSTTDGPNEFKYFYVIKSGNGHDNEPFFSGWFEKYEEAREKCLQKLISLI